MLASDSGMALAVVMLMSAILFLLATTVLLLVTYREKQTAAVTERNQSMHIADAGLNEYVYQLSQQYDYWKTHSTLGPTEMARRGVDGHPEHYCLGHAGAHIGRDAAERQVTDGAANGPFSELRRDYIVLVDKGPYSIGTGATFYRRRSLQRQHIQLRRHHRDWHEAGGTCTYGTSYAYNYPGGYKNNEAKVDFSQLTTDLQR